VSAASVSRWHKREREEGKPLPKALGGDQRSQAMEAHGAAILAIIAQNSDITLAEIRDALAQESVRVSISSLWRFFECHKITLKKVCACMRARPARCPDALRAMVRGSARS
jgi:transposase